MVEYAPSMKDPEFLKQIGYRYLKRAAETNGPTKESYKERAKGLVGDEIVSEVFPGHKRVTVLEKTYTYDDAFKKEYGQINTVDLGKDDIRIGDCLEIIAKVVGQNSFSGPEIGKWRGKNLSPQWAMTSNGYYKETIQHITPGPLVIGLNSRKNVTATVKVTRQVTPEPNIALLNTLIK